MEIDAIEGLKIAEAVVSRLEKLPSSPDRILLYPGLAMAAAPHSIEQSNWYLRRAVEEGRRALAEQRLWRAEPLPTGRGILGGDPQRELNAEKQWLRLRIELWQCVLESPRPAPEQTRASRRLKRLFADPEMKNWVGSCVIRSLEQLILDELGELEPQLMLAVWLHLQHTGTGYLHSDLAQYCLNLAASRHGNSGHDRVTEALIHYAVDHGVVHRQSIEVLSRHDPDKALRLAGRAEDGEKRRAQLCAFFTHLAQQDFDRALELARSQPAADGGGLQGQLAYLISREWPRQSLAKIERTMRGQSLRDWPDGARKWASLELLRRGELDKARAMNPQLWSAVVQHPAFVPPELRLQLLRDSLPHCGTDQGHATIIAAAIYKFDRAAGMEALETALAQNRSDHRHMSIYVSRMGPQALLKLYRSRPEMDTLFDLRMLTVLAQAAPDLALQEANLLTGEQRETALGHVAAGIAAVDWPRAERLLASLPEERRGNFLFDAQENFLVAHPTETARITGSHRRTILAQAASRLLEASGDITAIDQLIDTLSDRSEIDGVLGPVATHAVYRDPRVALRLIRRIENSASAVHYAYLTAVLLARCTQCDDVE